MQGRGTTGNGYPWGGAIKKFQKKTPSRIENISGKKIYWEREKGTTGKKRCKERELRGKITLWTVPIGWFTGTNL